MILLDTHVWIWWLLGTGQLIEKERKALDRMAARGEIAISAVSLWEVQLLHAKGRLVLQQTLDRWLRAAASPSVVHVLPLDVDVVLAIQGLPRSFHGDAADRIIVASSRAHKLRLATHDAGIRKSRAARVWKPG